MGGLCQFTRARLVAIWKGGVGVGELSTKKNFADGRLWKNLLADRWKDLNTREGIRVVSTEKDGRLWERKLAGETSGCN